MDEQVFVIPEQCLCGHKFHSNFIDKYGLTRTDRYRVIYNTKTRGKVAYFKCPKCGLRYSSVDRTTIRDTTVR